MKTQLILTPFLAAFFAVIASYVWWELRAPQRTDSVVDSSEGVSNPRDEARQAALQKQLRDLSARLDALEIDAEERARNTGTSKESAPSEQDSSGNPTTDAEEAAIDSAEQLARLFGAKGSGDALRGLVAEVVESERVAREARQREQAQQRRQELAEMREGPWGRHNLKVNRMAKKLGLDDRQTDAYYRLLVHYDEERQNLWKDDNGEPILASNPDPGSIQQHVEHVEQRSKELSRQFDEEFAQFLDDDQLAAYNALPPHERGNGSPAILSFSPEGGDFIGAAGGAIQVETIVVGNPGGSESK